MTQQRIVVVEDDAALHMVLCDLLYAAGYEVATALPDDALFVVDELEPSALVLGCAAGPSATRALHITTALRRDAPKLPIVLLTADRTLLEKPDFSAFFAVMEKPYSVPALLDALKRCALQPR